MSWNARAICIAILLLGIVGSAGMAPLRSEPVLPIAEDQLLDVGIQVLDPGIKKKSYLLTGYEYINPELRRSEAVYMAVHLMRTLQKTETFGLVRMMPSNSVAADLFVTGRIRTSSGRRLELELEVVDATGRRWLKKGYAQKASPGAYAESFRGNFGSHFRFDIEPFQDVYDEFADDLIGAQNRMKGKYLEGVRQVAELRFASQLAPGIFSDYLKVDRRGKVALDRLPSRDDPMLNRIRTIQTRDEVFLDLLTDRYLGFHASMDKPYDEYRATRYDVETSLRDSRARANLANVRSLFAPPTDSVMERSRTERIVGSLRRQAAAQAEYLDEISNAFATEVDPLKLELDGEVIRFEGTIDDQYSQWQMLLEKIFETETGMSAENRAFADDVNTRH